MSHEHKWRRCVETMVRNEGLAVVSVSKHASGHLRLVIGQHGRSRVLTTGRADGDPRQRLNVRSQIRKLARQMGEGHDH